MSKLFRNLTTGAKIFYEIFSDALNTITGEDFFMTREGMRKMHRKLAMGDKQFSQNIYRLQKSGLIEKIEDEYLITAKGLSELRLIKILNSPKSKPKKWDGNWWIVSFDIPENKKSIRDMFAQFLKRKGFVRLQDSVFIAPNVDEEEINFIRHKFGIEDYVNVFVGKCANIDDDTKLRKKFKL